jgi:hypothetical protein
VPLGPACQPVPPPGTMAVAHRSASGPSPVRPTARRGHCRAAALSHAAHGAPSSFSVPALHAAPSRTPRALSLCRATIKRAPAAARPAFHPVPLVHVRVPRSILHRPSLDTSRPPTATEPPWPSPVLFRPPPHRAAALPHRRITTLVSPTTARPWCSSPRPCRRLATSTAGPGRQAVAQPAFRPTARGRPPGRVL